MGCMLARMETYPATCNPEMCVWLSIENQINLFFTDMHARGKYPNYMARYFEENDIVIQKEPGDDEILLNNTVDFISFSYYMSVTESASADKGETCG